MVFESLVNVLTAERAPWRLFLVGLLYSSVAVLLSIFIFREQAGLVMIFLTVLPATHLIFTAVKMEEKKDLEFTDERFLLHEHGKVLRFLMFLFLGFVVSFSIWFVVLPDGMTQETFSTQIDELNTLRAGTTRASATGNVVNPFAALGSIFINNIWVMVFSIVFAFVYGSGAIFILTWNASVLGVAVGKLAESSANAFPAIGWNILRYSVHGVPEMLAYFMAGLAGSIVSVALIRHDFKSPKFRNVVMDSIDLVVLAVLVLGAAAFIEVFISTAFF